METTNHRTVWNWSWSRIDQAELLDLGEGTEDEVTENLAEIQRINDRLGGTPALTRHLFPRLLAGGASPDRPLTVMDLGTGGGGLPLRLAHWARRQPVNLRILAVDWSHRNLSLGGAGVRCAPEINLVQADAGHLPLARPAAGQAAPVDFVISSLLLHHLNPEALVNVLREAYALAGQAVIMTDLVRSRAAYLAFKAVQPVFARNYLTRHDGLLSIRRGYTPDELLALARRAGLREARVYTHFPWRMTLVADKP